MSVTATNVFDFMGTPSDIRTEFSVTMTKIISSVISEIEFITDRVIESETFTNVLFENGKNCEIHGDLLFFTGKYRDIYSITEIVEEGITLQEKTEYSDSKNYHYESRTGILTRTDGNYWSLNRVPLKISGKLGLCNPSDDSMIGFIEQAVIEMSAVKSRLWKTYIHGEEFTTNSYPEHTRKTLEKLINRFV